MPKVTCPTCQSAVEYSKDAEPGSTVMCPVCQEVFTPPGLPKKGYDPATDEDVYVVGEATTDAPDRDKARHAAEAKRGGKRRKRELEEMSRDRSEKRKDWFEGPEVWLLILAALVAIGVPVIVLLSRR
jgi:hypothetical protein